MKFFTYLVTCILLIVMTLFSTGCANEKINKVPTNLAGCTLLASPKEAVPLTYNQRKEADLNLINDSSNLFTAKLTQSLASNFATDTNYAVSPLSTYMALALVTECANGNTRDQLLSALQIDYNTLYTQFKDYYLSIINQFYSGDKQTGKISLINSIWVDNNVTLNSQCVNRLADNFYCYLYKTDFYNNNKSANDSLRKFIKTATNGLIDQDLQISPETVFLLLNTLYLKDTWLQFGDKIGYAPNTYDFTLGTGEVKNTKLLSRSYLPGKPFKGENYSTFFTTTYHGLKLSFVLPDDGYTVNDVLTAETIYNVINLTDYCAYDEAINTEYYTRCYFPEFDASYDNDLKNPLIKDFGLTDMFDVAKADFSSSCDYNVFCQGVKHVTKLKIDNRGIEGAAITAIPMPGAAGPTEAIKIYYDFIVDKAFGFILSDMYNHPLFTGAINVI